MAQQICLPSNDSLSLILVAGAGEDPAFTLGDHGYCLEHRLVLTFEQGWLLGLI